MLTVRLIVKEVIARQEFMVTGFDTTLSRAATTFGGEAQRRTQICWPL